MPPAGCPCYARSQVQEARRLAYHLTVKIDFSSIGLDVSLLINQEAAVNRRRAGWPPGLQYKREHFYFDLSDLTRAKKANLQLHWTTPASAKDAQKLFREFESKFRKCGTDILGHDDVHGVLKDLHLEAGMAMTWAMKKWLNWERSQLERENAYYEQQVCEALHPTAGHIGKQLLLIAPFTKHAP